MDVKSSGFGFSPDNLIGAHIGALARIPINNKLSVQPGILYSMKGFDLKYQGDALKMNFSTIELPINLTYNLSGDNNEGFYIMAGPYVSYALSGKMELKSNGLTQKSRFWIQFGRWI